MDRKAMADYLVIIIISAVFLALTVWALLGGLMASPSETFTMENARNNLENLVNTLEEGCSVSDNFDTGIKSHEFEDSMSNIHIEGPMMKATVTIEKTFSENVENTIEVEIAACDEAKICSPGAPSDSVNFGCSGGHTISGGSIEFKARYQEGSVAVMPVE